MTFFDALLYSLVGISVVFAALCFLIVLIKILTWEPLNKSMKQNMDDVKAANAAKAVEEAPKTLAPGTAGDLKLYNTDPRDAAMIMAIVADELGKPLNELRFISIKEVIR